MPELLRRELIHERARAAKSSKSTSTTQPSRAPNLAAQNNGGSVNAMHGHLNNGCVETIDRFCSKVAKQNEGIRIVRVPSPDGSIVRFLVAPADRFKDELLPAQRARQIDAGALPPEIYGHDIFELVNGNVVRLRDGSRVNLVDAAHLRTILDRFFVSGTYDNRVLVQCIDDIREGQRASRKNRS